MKNRNDGLDILRIWCCFCIIGIHVTGMVGDYGAWIYKLSQGVVRPPLWAFLALTGYFVLTKPIKSKLRFICYRLIHLIVPVIVYLYLYSLYYERSFVRYNPISLFITGDTIGHLWYVLMLVPLYFAMPFLQRFLLNSNRYGWSIVYC